MSSTMPPQPPQYGSPPVQDGRHRVATKKPVYKRWWFIILALLVVLTSCTIALGSTVDTGTQTSTGTPPAPEVPPADPAPAEPVPAAPATPVVSYPGQLDTDNVADAARTTNFDNVRTTATNLAATSTSFSSGLCSTVTHVNNDKDTLSFNIFEWKLQDPQGVARNISIFGDNDLGSGELAPGGTVTGHVCFEGEAVPGQYVLIYEPLACFTCGRGIWLESL
jgi:hypothetical protein